MKRDDSLVLVVVIVFAAMGLAVASYELLVPDCLSCDGAGASMNNALR
jgi:hypothetical protein